MTTGIGPFHPGELEAQRRAKVGDVASWAGNFIRDHMPDQHRAFFAALPFLVVAGGDGSGRPWITILEGPEGFIRSPDSRSLTVAATPPEQDPLRGALVSGSAIGILGIELATRRRNRLNGVVQATEGGFAVEVQQNFGNCPQYIWERGWLRSASQRTPPASVSNGLNADQQARIAAADTFFIGTGSHGSGGSLPFDGYDASHRGGPAGFVQVAADGTLRIPDYAGNKFFNTIGNLIRDPRVGLVFVEFETGHLLHITGRARIDWAPARSQDPNAHRVILVTVDEVVDRPAALALRWHRDGTLRRLRVVNKVKENDRITSFHLAASDGSALAPFHPGQHLPVELDVPGQPDRVSRSYSLSGAPNAGIYRISIKRVNQGIASGHLHSRVEIGATIDAGAPSGDFIMPKGSSPLVFASAGVGITPMLSMLHAALAEQPGRSIWFIHGARDGQNHAFGAEVDALVAALGKTVHRIFYSAPQTTDAQGTNFDAIGRVTAADLLALEPGAGAHYMLCGPARFLADIHTGLKYAGVPESQIHVETFGPTRLREM